MKRLFRSAAVMMALTAMQATAQQATWMDKDSDGKITKAEFFAGRAVIDKKKGTEFNQKYAERMFTAQDKNGDGVLTADELAK